MNDTRRVPARDIKAGDCLYWPGYEYLVVQDPRRVAGIAVIPLLQLTGEIVFDRHVYDFRVDLDVELNVLNTRGPLK